MLLAGIQRELGLNPIKTFGGDDLEESHLFTSAAISKEYHRPTYGFQSYIATGGFIELVSSNYLITGITSRPEPQALDIARRAGLVRLCFRAAHRQSPDVPVSRVP